jgi:hypothetical protein
MERLSSKDLPLVDSHLDLAENVTLFGRMADLGFVWDISHLADDGLDLGFPRVCASHANARSLTPTDRHLDDEVICAVADRGGVIGLVLYNGFLEPRWIGARHAPRTPGEACAAVPTECREGVLGTTWLNFFWLHCQEPRNGALAIGRDRRTIVLAH